MKDMITIEGGRMKTFNKRDVFTCVNAENAKNFLRQDEIEISLNNTNVMLLLRVKINDKWQPFGVLEE